MTHATSRGIAFAKHPQDHPNFEGFLRRPIWYLSHPLAPDSFYSFEDNMAHVLHMMQICMDAGFQVIAPYHTICLARGNADADTIAKGLACDIRVVQQCKHIILTGHRISNGMAQEMAGVPHVIDVTGLPDKEVAFVLQRLTYYNG